MPAFCIGRFIATIARPRSYRSISRSGWGPMSDQAVLDHLTITQSMRFFWYEWQHQPPIDQNQIVSHATNLHLIPSTPAIESQCKSLRTGELIHLRGSARGSDRAGDRHLAQLAQSDRHRERCLRTGLGGRDRKARALTVVVSSRQSGTQSARKLRPLQSRFMLPKLDAGAARHSFLSMQNAALSRFVA